MRNPFDIRLRIGISPDRVTLLDMGPVWRGAETLIADTPVAPDRESKNEWATALAAALGNAACNGQSTCVVLADEWVRYFIVTPPEKASSMQDCKAAAALRFQTLYGETPASWRLEADWRASRSFLACAVPETLILTLSEIAERFGLRLAQIQPRFIATWNRWHHFIKEDAWFGSIDETSLMLASIEKHGWHAVRAHALDDAAIVDPQWLEHHVNREALRLGVAPPVRVQLCGKVPATWISENPGKFSCQPLGQSNNAAMSAGLLLARSGIPL